MVFQNDLKIIFIDVYLTREWSGLTLISEFSEFSATAWKVSKYGVFSGPYFTAFGLNTDQKTPYLDTFHALTSKAFDDNASL